MSRLKAVHHITIRVQDLDRTASFFERVLGWDVDSSLPDRRRVQVGETRLVFKLPLPGTPEGDRFNEARIGVDHISLLLNDLAEMVLVERRLRDAGVDTRGVQTEASTGASVIVFRDPDNMQWEFYVE